MYGNGVGNGDIVAMENDGLHKTICIKYSKFTRNM